MTKSAQRWTLVVCLSLALSFYFLSGMLTPFIASAVLAYMVSPLVNKLQDWRVPRTLSVVWVFLVLIVLLLAVLFLLIPVIDGQVRLLVNKAPAFFNWLQTTAVPWLNKHFDVKLSLSLKTVQDAVLANWGQAGQMAQRVISTITHSGLTVVFAVMNLLLVFVVTFYLLRDWDYLLERTRELLPRGSVRTVERLAQECDEVLRAFFGGQLTVMISIGLWYSLGLSFVGLELALLIGLVAGLISFIPYLGFLVGLLAASFATIWQFQDWIHLFYVLIVFTIGNVLEGMVLIPWLVGDSIGLHPVAVIFSVLAGGHLFGFTGVLIALPVAAIVMVLLRHVRSRYVESDLYEHPGAAG